MDAGRHRWYGADPWHDGAVSDVEVAYAIDAEFGVDDGLVIFAHATCTNRVEISRRTIADELFHIGAFFLAGGTSVAGHQLYRGEI